MFEDNTAPKEPTLKNLDPRALNAYRHGLTGQIHVLTGPDLQAYKKHCVGVHESLAPEGPLETDLAQSIAEDRWRLKRAAGLESSIFALGYADPGEVQVNGTNPEIDTAFAQARTWLSQGKNIQLLSLYEHRINRHVEKNLELLRRLQAERAAAIQKAVEEAELLTQLAESEGKVYDIEREFMPEMDLSRFVISTSLIARLVMRNRRLAQAKRQFQPQKKHSQKAA